MNQPIAAQSIVGNAILQSLTAIPVTFEEQAASAASVFNQLPKAECVAFDWKSFISNDKNKTQLISLLLDRWKTDKYATRLIDRNLSHVIGKKVFRFTYTGDNHCIQIARRKQIHVL